jgi:N-acetylglucosamine malate deacetylase 1
MKKVLVIAAHADDEALGCAGTIIKHTKKGDPVEIILLADGVGSREGDDSAKLQHLQDRCKMAEAACSLMGANNVYWLGFPDNNMDAVPLLEIVQKLEPYIQSFQPDIVYTHYRGDLNIDHQLTYRAVMTACRPLPGSSVSKIYSFEVPSSTEWTLDSVFSPNHFVDIQDELALKLEVLQIYAEEMRPFPHSRSFENVEALASYRGASVGLHAAEGFTVERSLA